jgi:septal ring factor EnvC (AmiA/AmiB activator)
MVSANDELSLRVERLERDVRRLAGAAAVDRREDPVNRITFLGWLKLSGPTFAVMVFGFGLLWQSQQALSGQMLETSRSVGRLEGAIQGVESRLAGLDVRLAGIDSRLAGIDTQLARLADAIDRLNDRVDRIEAR